MISFKMFFRQKMARFFTILFASLLMLANVGVYVSSSIQYTRQLERQQDSFIEMMKHLIVLEDVPTSIVYVEHYGHTHGVDVTYYDVEGNILYQSERLPNNDIRIPILSDEGLPLGSVAFDYRSSILGGEVLFALVILNVFLLLLFGTGLGVLYRYLNRQSAFLDEDLDKIGKEEQTFRFSDIGAINERYVAALRTEKDMKALQTHYVQTLAHDVKTPLTVIKAYLEGIQLGRLQFDEQVNRDLLTEIATIEQLVPQFIAMDMTQVAKKQNIAPLIRAELAKLEEVFKTKKMVVETRIDDFEWMVSPIDIVRITEHLVFNAFYYSGPSGKIEVVLDAKTRSLSIKDHGIGMSPETLEKVKKGPYREEHAAAYHQKGSGIGLQIVFEIVKRIKGTIEIASQVDAGTQVKITF
jgi:two-component system phosphate regulon sensor histidine kinase PhoR